MWEHLKPGSSPVDWCEGNYQVSANIAEFVNTVSWLLGKCIEIILQKKFAAECECVAFKNRMFEIEFDETTNKTFLFCVWQGSVSRITTEVDHLHILTRNFYTY